MTIDSDDHIIVSGQFFESFTLGSTTLISSGDSDSFVAKFNDEGTFIWAKSFGGTERENVSEIAINANNDIFLIGGSRSHSFNFGSQTIIKYGQSAYDDDLLLVKYSSSGAELWAKNAGGAGASAEGYNITVDNDESVFLNGIYSGSSITFDHLTFPASSGYQSFIVKIDRDGNTDWGQNYFGPGDFISKMVTADAGIYMIGHSGNSSIDFGNFILNNSIQGSYYFLARMDREGSFYWATATGGSDFARFGNIVITPDHDIYMNAVFTEPSITLGSTNLISEGQTDVLIAKMTDTTIGLDGYDSASFLVYPNPFSSQTILSAGKELQNATLTITNAVGQVVKKMENLYGNQITIERENLASGVYYLNVSENGELQITKKIVVK